MSPFIQKTLENPISIEGVGLHSGENVKIKIYPADPNMGITFKRTDLKKNNFVLMLFWKTTREKKYLAKKNRKGSMGKGNRLENF